MKKKHLRKMTKTMKKSTTEYKLQTDKEPK